MPNLFFGKERDGKIVLDEDETKHLKVARVEEEDTVEVTDGEGMRYVCTVEEIRRKKTICKILERYEVERESGDKLIAVVPAGRWERLRLLIEKCVELGVDTLIVHRFKRSQRSYSYGKIFNIVKEASKQCKRYLFPKIEISESLDEILKEGVKYYTLDPSGENIDSIDFKGDIGVITGPEGGFDREERSFLREKTTFISLGRKILRFETASILAIGFIALKKKKI